MDLIAFGSMIVLVLYLIACHDGSQGVILPMTAVYAFLQAFKLIPAFHQIYGCTFEYKRKYLQPLEIIQKDLIDSKCQKVVKVNSKLSYLPLKKHIILENITFTYPSLEISTINQMNLSIPANSVVVWLTILLVSGKSALIDIILGLIKTTRRPIETR